MSDAQSDANHGARSERLAEKHAVELINRRIQEKEAIIECIRAFLLSPTQGNQDASVNALTKVMEIKDAEKLLNGLKLNWQGEWAWLLNFISTNFGNEIFEEFKSKSPFCNHIVATGYYDGSTIRIDPIPLALVDHIKDRTIDPLSKTSNRSLFIFERRFPINRVKIRAYGKNRLI